MSGGELRVIGHVRTGRTNLEDTPVQAALNPDEEGTIEIDPSYREALDGLDEFTHLWVITWLAALDNETPEPALRQVPFLLARQPRELGIFATRGPRRPNPLGLSLVRLAAVDDITIRFTGVDMVDGTPVVDLKPFVARFDRPDGSVRSGWFDTVAFEDNITPASLRPG